MYIRTELQAIIDRRHEEYGDVGRMLPEPKRLLLERLTTNPPAKIKGALRDHRGCMCIQGVMCDVFLEHAPAERAGPWSWDLRHIETPRIHGPHGQDSGLYTPLGILAYFFGYDQDPELAIRARGLLMEVNDDIASYGDWSDEITVITELL